jgi:hypothetical protein
VPPYSHNGVQIVPCEGCGRTGVRSHGRLCMMCAKRKWRLDPDNRERDRASAQRWKNANPERRRESDRAYRQRGREARLRAVPEELIYCIECGEQMIEWSPEGICGFCEEEMAA